MADLWELLKDCIPNDHARQVTATYYLDQAMSGPDAPDLVVDLGCGADTSAERFRRHKPDVTWLGVDIDSSLEARARVAGADPIVYYDGIHLPLRSDSVPLIYSKQVFEHVHKPAELMAEIARVLRPGGVFIGSASSLEPYHSMSLWSYTPYGLRVLVDGAGLRLEEIRPGIDALTLIERSFKHRPPEYNKYWSMESPLNQEIDAWGDKTNRRPALVNLRKLTYCGHLVFRVRKEA